MIGHYDRICSTWQPLLSDGRNQLALFVNPSKVGDDDRPFQVCGSHQAIGTTT